MSSSSPPAAEVRSLGYAPLRIVAAHLGMRPATDSDRVEEELPTAFQWNWRFATEDTFDVVFGVKLEASRQRTEEVEALFVGTFQLPEAEPAVKLDQFVRTNAIAAIYPFVREAICSMTSRGYFGAYLLPLLNTVALSRRLEGQDTEGYRALVASAELRKRVTRVLSAEYCQLLDKGDNDVVHSSAESNTATDSESAAETRPARKQGEAKRGEKKTRLRGA